LNNYMNDFGNGWYNDHHFHYGYYLYASALMGEWNDTFIDEYGDYVDAMMYDVTSEDSAFFPLARHKAWFDGHSFASGLFPFASGKSMESSSESINCYYSAYLWCMVRGTNKLHTDRFNFARLLLATEIRGVQTYWHMHATSNGTEGTGSSTAMKSLYNPILAKNFMIGNLGMMDATVSTWFGNNPIYVHMINFLPVTAITRELFDKAYVEEEFNNVIEPIYNSVEMAWKGYVICDLALLDPNKAFADALKLRSFELDQAISQSQVLYFASTMKDFNDSNVVESESQEPTEEMTETDAASCTKHPGCTTLGLTGNCCPPASGSPNLGCCAEFEKDDGDESLCSQHEACEAAGLLGTCCPTQSGFRLSCCDV